MHIAAAEWILRLPEGRALDLLDAGCKAVLIVLWSHTKWKREQDASCEECYPSAATVADATGSTLKATRKRLARLVAARWARHEKRANGEWGWALAWREPFPLQGYTPPVPALPLQGPSTAPPGSQHYPSRGTKQETNEDIERSSEQESASKSAPAVVVASKPSKSRARKPIEVKPTQEPLPIPGAEPRPAPEPDQPQLVADRLRQRQAETREALAMPKPGHAVLDAKRRSKINARIAEHGLEACFRVIDVDAAECLEQGPNGKSWVYWNLDTPFSDAANFERRLNRWREDGDHVVWGVQQPTGSSAHRARGSSMPGQNERLRASAEADNRGREQAEAERQAQLEYLRASGKLPRLPDPPADIAGDEVSF